jgi:predicted alpha-1,2-mannosidase
MRTTAMHEHTPQNPFTRQSRIRRRIAVIATGALIGAGALAIPRAPAEAAPSPAQDLTSLVNPFIGTQNFGNTFPGASMPFGMVQESPDNGGATGYDYDTGTIYGFSQTHLSGVGCGMEGELPLMPTTGPITTTDYRSYASGYSHSDEQAQPGYYQVHLAKYDVSTELTATERTGWQRYTFPAGSQANVLFNAGKANMTVFDSYVKVVGNDTVEGYVHAGHFCAGHDEHTLYFVAHFDRPFSSFGTWQGDALSAGSRDSAAGQASNGAYVSFDTTAGRAVTARIALSYTGLDGAEKNMAAETSGADFDTVRQAAHDAWNTRLGQIEISGGTHDRQTSFYTALYHSMLGPNLVGDVDGRYMGFDGTVHQAQDYTPYANLSLWDTYRPQNQLLELLAPDVSRNVALSILAVRREGGWLPRWELLSSETNIMTGDPVTPFLVENWSQGLLAGHEEEAYQALKQNATEVPPASAAQNGRLGNPWYTAQGYAPCIPNHVPAKGGDDDLQHGASATLEYAVADAALSLMANGLGHKQDATLFAQRGQNYRSIWDKSTGFFRPRTANGTWFSPYDPATASSCFHEGDAYQYQWLVPQDPAGNTQLLGGASATAKRLDDFFAYRDLLTDPAGTARTKWVGEAYGYYGAKTYNPNNEPDLIAPYSYLWTDRPDHTAAVVHAAETLFTNAPNGMTGNDDLGAMSSWYVFSSLGLYPYMPGGRFFTMTSPQFPHAVVHIADGPRQGGSLVINALGAGADASYITKVNVSGKQSTRSWVPGDAVAHGGTIDLTLAGSPPTGQNAWGTGKTDQPPSVDGSASGLPRQLSAGFSSPQSVVMPSASAAATMKLALDVLATAPADARIQVSAQAPAGWSVAPSATVLTLHSGGLPTQESVPLSVTVPAGVADGDYPVTATASSSGVPTVRVVTTVRVAHAIDFDTGTAAEQPWLSDADGSQSAGAGNRFADNDHYFVYRFPLPADTTGGKVTLSIDNEFLVQASSDGQNWTTVLTESQQVHDGSNKADRSVDIGPFLGADKTVYIRVEDSFPQDGWGGRVSHLTVTVN